MVSFIGRKFWTSIGIGFALLPFSKPYWNSIYYMFIPYEAYAFNLVWLNTADLPMYYPNPINWYCVVQNVRLIPKFEISIVYFIDTLNNLKFSIIQNVNVFVPCIFKKFCVELCAYVYLSLCCYNGLAAWVILVKSAFLAWLAT